MTHLLLSCRSPSERASRQRRRSLGFLFIAIGTVGLLWDFSILLRGMGIAELADFAQIWQGLHQASFNAVAQGVSNVMGLSFWTGLVLPLMNIPVSLLFGLPGLFLLFANTRDIEVHAPSALEMEMNMMRH